MWPTKRETMTRDECKKCLRCLELEAYGNMVSVLRAQGPFTSEKQKLLQELAKVLHISNERHRAEVRRAVNDEKLATIAEQLNGPNTGTERWTVEGRRAVPLLPRLKARSAFATLANSLSLATIAANKRKVPVRERTEDAKDVGNESLVKTTNVRERSIGSPDFAPDEEKVIESNRNEEEVNDPNDGSEKYTTVSRKHKLSCPVSPTFPNKVLVVPSGSSTEETLNRGTADKGSMENAVRLSRIPTNSTLQHRQNVTLIPLNVNCEENATGNSHRLMAICPVTTISSSNGPGPPPQAKQLTTLTCKKLPTTLNDQTTAKMGVALNSSKTVNMSSRRSDAKLGSKTNVIVIQKGQTKGVTLSQAGKEVLEKVIMGGKSLRVANQRNVVVPCRVALNNGDQGLTKVFSTTNSSCTESVTPDVKSGSTVTFDLRQDILEKNKAFSSRLLESSNVLTSESKTVIQTTDDLSKEPSNSDLNIQDEELVLVKPTDAAI